MPETQKSTPDQAQPKSQVNSVLDEVDALAEGFDSKPPEPKAKARPDPIRMYAERKLREEETADFNSAVDGALKELKKSEKLKGLGDKFLKGYLYAHAEEVPEFDAAFKNRKNNPKAWAKARGEIAAIAEAEFSVPDSKVTSDVEAARAAVRGSSTEEPPKQDILPQEKLNAMSDRELASYKRKLEAERPRAR